MGIIPIGGIIGNWAAAGLGMPISPALKFGAGAPVAGAALPKSCYCMAIC